MRTNKDIFVCSECGSEDIVKDAWVRWNVETQEWEIEETFSETYCHECEGDCYPVRKGLNDDKT